MITYWHGAVPNPLAWTCIRNHEGMWYVACDHLDKNSGYGHDSMQLRYEMGNIEFIVVLDTGAYEIV